MDLNRRTVLESRRQGKSGILERGSPRSKCPEERKYRAGVEKRQEIASMEGPWDGVHRGKQGSHIHLNSLANERKKKNIDLYN